MNSYVCCALSVASLTEEALAEFESHHLPPAGTKAELALTTSITSATAANDKMLRFMSAPPSTVGQDSSARPISADATIVANTEQ